MFWSECQRTSALRVLLFQVGNIRSIALPLWGLVFSFLKGELSALKFHDSVGKYVQK